MIVIFVPAARFIAPVMPLTEVTIFGAYMFPLNVAPDAEIPPENCCNAVNV